MKRTLFISLVPIFLCAVVFSLFMVFNDRNRVEYHKRAWFEASQELTGRPPRRLTLRLLWEEVFPRLRWKTDPSQRIRRHENELIRLGYLTTHEFFLTNQVTTFEFRSNFFNTIWQRFGTNGECVWTCQASTNHAGYIVRLPAEDVARWEVIFRECATRYASNFPTVQVSTP